MLPKYFLNLNTRALMGDITPAWSVFTPENLVSNINTLRNVIDTSVGYFVVSNMKSRDPKDRKLKLVSTIKYDAIKEVMIVASGEALTEPTKMLDMLRNFTTTILSREHIKKALQETWGSLVVAEEGRTHQICVARDALNRTHFYVDHQPTLDVYMTEMSKTHTLVREHITFIDTPQGSEVYIVMQDAADRVVCGHAAADHYMTLRGILQSSLFAIEAIEPDVGIEIVDAPLHTLVDLSAEDITYMSTYLGVAVRHGYYLVSVPTDDLPYSV